MFSLKLSWERDSKGYDLVEGPYGKVIVRLGGKWIATEPLAGNFDMHYAELAGLKGPDDVKKFVNKYGYLKSARGLGGQAFKLNNDSVVWQDEGYDGEKVDEYLEAAKLIDLVMRAHKQRRKYSPNIQKSFDRIFSGEQHGNFKILPDLTRGFRFSFEATSLMNAIWIQLAQKVSGGIKFKSCRYCGAWFEVGAGTGKRADSEFCKTTHRVAFSRTLSKEA